MELSNIEQEVYDFIEKNTEVSAIMIIEQLGNKHIGALGKLIRQDKVIKFKKKEAKDDYATKMVIYYRIKKVEE